MPLITIPIEELLKNDLLEPAWYSATVEAYRLEKAKTGESLNHYFTFRLERDGRTLDHSFNSKMMKLMEPFLVALFGPVTRKDKVFQFDSDACIGKTLDVKVYQDTWDGRLNNKINGYLPYGTNKDVPF